MTLFLAFICLQNLMEEKILGKPLVIIWPSSSASVYILIRLKHKLASGLLTLPVKFEVSKVIFPLFVNGNLFNYAAVAGKNSKEGHFSVPSNLFNQSCSRSH